MNRASAPCLAIALITSFACTAELPSSSTDGQDSETGDTDDTDETGGEALGPTWHQDIAPLVTAHCGSCHVEGGVAPVAFETYEQASAWAELAFAAMDSGQMPPWGQDDTADCQPRMGFLDDPRLSDEDLELFAAWIAAGTPEGDPETAAPLPEPPQLALADATHSLANQGPVTVPPGDDQFWCLVIDPGFEQDMFVDGFQIVPGNDQVVHHVLVYVDVDNQSDALADGQGHYPCFGGPKVDGALIGVWAPGLPAQTTPPDVAFRIPANTKLVMQMHYHPTGVEEIDLGTAFEIRASPEPPAWVAEFGLPGNESSQDNTGFGLQPGPNDSGPEPEFRIPAGESHHVETMIVPVPPTVNGKVINEVVIFEVGTHMHYVGVDMRLGVNRIQPEQGTGIDEECFIQTPRYSFEWQRGYRYDGDFADMPRLRPGDLLTLECTYDNSLANPYVVEAIAEQGLDGPVDVFLGDETLDEMCIGLFGFAAPYQP